MSIVSYRVIDGRLCGLSAFGTVLWVSIQQLPSIGAVIAHPERPEFQVQVIGYCKHRGGTLGFYMTMGVQYLNGLRSGLHVVWEGMRHADFQGMREADTYRVLA